MVLKPLTSAADKNGQESLGYFLGVSLFPVMVKSWVWQEPLLQPPSSLWLYNVPRNWKQFLA